MTKGLKLYSGLVGHKNEKQIQQFIISEKSNGVSYRDLSEKILNAWGLNVTHTTIKAYCDDILGGISAIESGTESTTNAPPAFDKKVFEEILAKDPLPTELDEVKAYILTLCKCNILAHIAGKERLKKEYADYLKIIRG
jgi:hypothetical protein